MPARKVQQKVRDYIRQYGYDFQEKDVLGKPIKRIYKNNFTQMDLVNLRTGHRERITLKTFRNRVNRGDYKEYSPENDINRIGLSRRETVHKSSFDRWLEHQDRYVISSSPQEQHKIYNDMQTNIKMLMRKKSYSLGNVNNKESFKALIEAFKVVGPRLGNKEIHLTFYDKDGHKYFRILNEYTVSYMEEMIYFDNFDIKDSFDDFVHSINEIQKIDIEFSVKRPGKRINAGFFPYLNKTDIDLRRYGIFWDIKDKGINDSCLIQAFKSSGILTDTELNMLQNFVKTRTIPQAILNDISTLFKVHINCKIYYGTDRNSHVDFGLEHKEDRSIKLIIINSHYILNERTNITEFYIRKYEEINKDARFKNHPRKTMLQKFDSKRYAFSKQGMKITKLIQKMIDNKMLVLMTEQQMNELEWSFRPSSNSSFEGFSRPIIIADKKVNYYKKTHKILQTKHFFGYEPEANEVEYRLNELQKIVDSLPLRKQIDVALYYKFSDLMQKIMYEFGCFDGVLELCGNKANKIREQCVFPHSHTYNDKPFYSNKKLYYIDLKGAYLSAITNIPKGEDFVEKNTKIKKLIETLYDARMKAKKNGYTKLATTLKFMMNSCYGYSIRRPKTIKHKYTNNVDNYIETFGPYVIGYNYSALLEGLALQAEGKTGYVSTVNSFVPHFTHPQFAKEILDNFNKKMEEISRIVKVYYFNIDSVLIDESDYNKLINLGMVSDKLGDFKIEHIFTEIAIKSQKQFVATTESGEKIFHCIKGVDYNSFVNDEKKNVFGLIESIYFFEFCIEYSDIITIGIFHTYIFSSALDLIYM